MSKFNVGDRVLVHGVHDKYAKYNGMSGSVIKSHAEDAAVVILDEISDDGGVSYFFFDTELESLESVTNDDVNHPSHYTSYKGIEVIQLTEQMNFNRGNVIKYTSRAGLKNPGTEIQDLEKAKWYLEREITRIKNL